MRHFRLYFGLLMVALSLTLPVSAAPNFDTLPSWNNTPTKQAIVRFVDAVGDPQNESYVPPDRRIAVVDVDGTLLVEKPLPVAAMFAIERLRTLVTRQPALQSREAFKAASENNLEYFIDLHDNNFPRWLEIMINAASGMPQSMFRLHSRGFFNTHLHPDFKVPYRDLVYRPMLELLGLLKREQFKVFLVTGSASGFARGVAKDVFQLSSENVVGSTVMLTYSITDRGPLLIRGTQNVEPSNVGRGKAINIERYIGQRPILAIGNSDGDIEMFEWTTVGQTISLAMLLRHDDDTREYAYSDSAEKLLQKAPSRGWLGISMKQDFRTVFGLARE